jgi:putative spermidine/putrescine transport system substrate-binding protein
MKSLRPDRRQMMGGAAALAGITLFGRPAVAKGSVTAAIYPGNWDEQYRAIVLPALKKAHDVDLALEPLFAVDQIAKVVAARGVAPFDSFVLDPGPRVTAIERGLLEPFDGKQLTNASKLAAAGIDGWGAAVNSQIVGIAYNPKKLPKPKSWKDLFQEPYASRLGLTGFQTTFGTVSLIEMAKAFGGSEANIEPIFAEIKKILPKIAAVTAPAALPGMFQQGQIDITYTNTNNVTSLKERGVDIEFVAPEEGAITFVTTLHITKGAENKENAYKYIDTAIATAVQEALMKSPAGLLPTNKEVALAGDQPIKSLDDLSKLVTHDWTKINPQRAAWIERFNKEVTK